MTDHAPTEIRPRYPLPSAPARHLPVRQPQIRYVPGAAVMAPHDVTLTPPTDWREEIAPHPVDVRRPRATSHRAKPITRLWDEHWLFGITMLGVGVVLGALGLGLLMAVSR